ncbi:MAG: MarR family winged helix-turn-helix transcriptional regulator [Bariatricus sp.]
MMFWENQKVITTFYCQCMKPVCEQFQLTKIEFAILMFLANNPQYDTASDIIRIRALTKSHVSSAIKQLENKGFIQTAFHDGNKKTVHISILDAAKPVIAAGRNAQQLFGKKLFQGFSNDEFELCIELFHRMCDNARFGIKEVQ